MIPMTIMSSTSVNPDLFFGIREREREREFSHCVRVRRYRYTCLSIWDYYFESIFILLAEFKSSSDHI